MIVVEGQGEGVQEICLTRNGQRIVLSEKSDPKDLFSALFELARFISNTRKKSNGP